MKKTIWFLLSFILLATRVQLNAGDKRSKTFHMDPRVDSSLSTSTFQDDTFTDCSGPWSTLTVPLYGTSPLKLFPELSRQSSLTSTSSNGFFSSSESDDEEGRKTETFSGEHKSNKKITTKNRSLGILSLQKHLAEHSHDGDDFDREELDEEPVNDGYLLGYINKGLQLGLIQNINYPDIFELLKAIANHFYANIYNQSPQQQVNWGVILTADAVLQAVGVAADEVKQLINVLRTLDNIVLAGHSDERMIIFARQLSYFKGVIAFKALALKREKEATFRPIQADYRQEDEDYFSEGMNEF